MTLLFISIRDIAESWNNIFFSYQSTLTLCIFRMLVGLIILIETKYWLSTYKQLLLPTSWFGYSAYSAHLKPIRFSLLNYLPATNQSVKTLLVLQFIGGLCLFAGVFAQAASFLCFLTLVSIHNRNIYALSSADTIHRYFCLFLIFAPSDSQLSILGPTYFIRPEATDWVWTLVMLRFFMANIYLKNVLFKLMGEQWRNGTATKSVFSVRIWNRRQLPNWLNKSWFYRITTYGTLIIETALFSLIWINEFRLYIILIGITFHLCLWFFLRIGYFQFTMIVGLMTFIEPIEFMNFSEWVLLLSD